MTNNGPMVRQTPILDQILEHLRKVRRTTSGWSACCPAHDDRHPSLSIRNGHRRILLHCFAGCPSEAICRALGFRFADLFLSKTGTYRHVRERTPTQDNELPPIERWDWRDSARQLQELADSYWLRSERVQMAARGLSIATWTDNEITVAIKATARAREDRRIGEALANLVYQLRAYGLAEDATH